MVIRTFNRLVLQAIILQLLLLACQLAVHADSWPSAFHDPANTGISAERIHLPLSLAWKAHVSGYGHEYPVATQRILVVPGSEELIALRLTDGARIWKIPGAFNGAYIADGTLYSAKKVMVRQHAQYHLLAIDVGTGRLRWESNDPLLLQYIGGITGYHGRLFVVCSDNLLVEVDPANGRPTRKVQFPGWAMGLPAFAGQYAYWGWDHTTTTLTLPTWKVTNWGHIFDGGNSFPIVWNNYLAIQGPITTTQVHRLLDGKPKFLFRCKGIKGVGHGIAPHGEGLMLARSDNPAGYLIARSLADGKPKWQVPMHVTSMCSATRDYVFVCGQNRKRGQRGKSLAEQWQDALFIIRARDGKILGKHKLPFEGTYPIIANGRIIVIVRGEVRCYAYAGR
ncbi:MAG: outer membrane protein assembly factor BamB family protein [Armatimonadota bacterium]